MVLGMFCTLMGTLLNTSLRRFRSLELPATFSSLQKLQRGSMKRFQVLVVGSTESSQVAVVELVV